MRTRSKSKREPTEIVHHFSDDAVAELAWIIQDLTLRKKDLRVIELHFDTKEPVWGQPLLDAISMHRDTLETLVLIGGNPSAGPDVLNALGEMKNLEYINIYAGDFSGGLGEALSNFPALTQLNLDGVDTETMRSIADKHSITDLHLGDVRIADDGLKLIKGMPNIESITMCVASDCAESFTARGLDDLSAKRSMKYVDISNAPRDFGRAVRRRTRMPTRLHSHSETTVTVVRRRRGIAGAGPEHQPAL